MRRAIIAILLAVGSVFGFLIDAWAGDASIQANGAVTWQAGVDRVEIGGIQTARLKHIHPKSSTPVEVSGDPRRNTRGGSLGKLLEQLAHLLPASCRCRGVYRAQAIAEEKAKAAIVRFLNQSVSSTRLV